MLRSILPIVVVAVLFTITGRAAAQESPVVVTPTGTFVVYGSGDDWNLEADADLQAEGFLLRGSILGEGNAWTEQAPAISQCRPCLAGDTVAVVGNAHFLLSPGDPPAQLTAGDAVGVWMQGQFDEIGSRVELTPIGGIVTLPKNAPGKGKPNRQFVLTVPIRADFAIEVRPYLGADAPVTYVQASNFATATVTVRASWDALNRRWEYWVDSDEAYTYVLGATFKGKNARFK